MHALLALTVGLTFLCCGFLLKMMGASGKSRNPVAGYRTPRSMKSPETWIAANLYAAKAFHVAGAAILFTGAFLWWKPLPEYNDLVILGIMFVALAAIVWATEIYLRRHFNADGVPKTIPPGKIFKPSPGPAAVEVKRAGKLPYSQLEYLLETASLTGIILGAGLLFYRWPQLPDLVPRHYNFQGVVDGWGGKGAVLSLPIVTLLLYLFLTLLRFFAPIISGGSTLRRPLRLSMDLLTWMKTWAVWIFTYLTWGTVEIALGRTTTLSPIFLPLALILSLVIMAVYCTLIIRAQKSDRKIG